MSQRFIRLSAIIIAVVFGLAVVGYGFLGGGTGKKQDQNIDIILDTWLGTWQAFDKDQYPFVIIIRRDGSATHDYADGGIGVWKIHEGGVLIQWQGGKKDFLFNGVMGLQRLHKPSHPRAQGYSSAMKKIK